MAIKTYATAAALTVVGTSGAAQTEFKLRPSMQWYTTASTNELASSRLNSENSLLQIEDRSVAIDLRPSLKADVDKFQLIARPQLRSQVSSAKVDGKRRAEHQKSTSKWIEAYGALAASDKVLVSLGLQNYQWGAAESLNPSNRIFHETVDSKGLLYTVQGRNMMRVNISWSKNLSSIFMAETEPSKETPVFQAEEVFQSKSLMKHEVNWNSGADYAGIVLGAAETDGPWVGEYLSQSLFSGLSVYADASHQRGSNAWYPVETAVGGITNLKVVELQQSKKDDSKIHTLGVGGLRYSFEGGSDVRFEYVVNTAGWDTDETRLGLLAIDRSRLQQLPTIEKNAARWVRPGLEFRGRQYGLGSLRVPDLFEFKDLTVYVRNLRSLQDHSATYYGSLEYGFGEASTFLLSGFVATGQQDQELRGFVASSAMAGLRQDF